MLKQKVVCVNDEFATWVRALYDELPVKNQIYTIRGMAPGVMPTGYVKKQEGDKGPTVFVGEEEIVVYVEELKNADHPVSKSEMGFLSDRFAPIKELTTEEMQKRFLKQQDKAKKEKDAEIWKDTPATIPAEKELVPVEK